MGKLTGYYVPSLPEVVWVEKVYGVISLAAGIWNLDQICYEAIEDLKIAN